MHAPWLLPTPRTNAPQAGLLKLALSLAIVWRTRMPCPYHQRCHQPVAAACVHVGQHTLTLFIMHTSWCNPIYLQGKSPLCLSQAPDGSPRPRGFANLTTTKHNRRMQDADKARQAQIEKARKDNANLTDDEVMEKLEDVFIAYSDNLLYCNTGRYELDSVGWCRLLRDCRCADGKPSNMQACMSAGKVSRVLASSCWDCCVAHPV